MLKRLLAGSAVLGLLCGQALAAVTANSVVTPQGLNPGFVQFLQGTDSAGTYKILVNAGANGSKCLGAHMSTDDGTATHLVTLQVTAGQVANSGVRYGGAALTTVLSAGFANATPAQSLMAPNVWPGLAIDSDGNPYLILGAGNSLQATFASALTASTRINLQITCFDY